MAYERSVMDQVLSHVLAAVRRAHLLPTIALNTHVVASQGVRDFIEGILGSVVNLAVSPGCTVRATSCHVNDVVLYWSVDKIHVYCGEILLLADADGLPLAVIDQWDRVSANAEQGVAVFSRRRLTTLVDAEDIMHCCCYSISGSEVRVLVPWHLRNAIGRSL